MDKAHDLLQCTKFIHCSWCVIIYQQLDKTFLSALFRINFSYLVSKILNSNNLGKLNFILVSHYSLAESEICWPLRFILNGKYSALIMTSIKENAFEI